MTSKIDDLLDMVDEWKLKVHQELKGMTQQQRRAFWSRVGRHAREMGFHIVEAEDEPAKPPTKRVRRTG
jgi:hypothetical protein